MKYLVNRETKEHIRFDDRYSVPLPGWDIVEADAEGWIKWDGGECPLPESVLCYVKLRGCDDERLGYSHRWQWSAIGRAKIVAYRPILDKPFVSKTDESPVPEQQCNDLLGRLKSAHEAAQSIPDLLAELREVLGSMGYDVVARSPFVERTDYESGVAESESGTETPLDMSDWRNWREGDFVVASESATEIFGLTFGEIYEVDYVEHNGAEENWIGIKKCDRGVSDAWTPKYFRFHSRPEVKS